MIGVLHFSSRVSYGKNKRGVPYFLFTNKTHKSVKVSSRQGIKENIDFYAKINIINNTSNPMIGELVKLVGPVNCLESTKQFILEYYNIIPNKTILLNLISDKIDRIKYMNANTFSIDPNGCKDIDDAFSFEFKDNELLLSIHITDGTLTN